MSIKDVTNSTHDNLINFDNNHHICIRNSDEIRKEITRMAIEALKKLNEYLPKDPTKVFDQHQKNYGKFDDCNGNKTLVEKVVEASSALPKNQWYQTSIPYSEVFKLFSGICESLGENQLNLPSSEEISIEASSEER